MNADFTPAMFDALRSINNGIFSAKEIGVDPRVLNALEQRGFLAVDRDYSPFLYSLTPMGQGAVAVLNAEVTPRECDGMIARIQRTVANYYSIPLAEMASGRRPSEVVRPRQIAMFLARELTPHSLPTIGRYFGGRDHTTVLYAVRKIERLAEEDWRLDNDIQNLIGTLNPPEPAKEEAHRTDRTPCFKCGVRADIGCLHTRIAA